MTSITRLLMAVLVLAGTISIAACDKQDESGATSGTTSGESSQTQTGAATEQPAAGSGTTTTP